MEVLVIEHKGHRQRLRDRFINNEDGAYMEAALLELLLTYAIPIQDVQPLAKSLLMKYGSLNGVLEAPLEELAQFNGLKENSAVLIKLVDWIRGHIKSRSIPNKIELLSQQSELFKIPAAENEAPIKRIDSESQAKQNIVRHGSLLFGKSLLKEAIQILPNLPDTDSLNEIRIFLRDNLHFSSEQTRKRYVSYITRRLFPDGIVDLPLRTFARTFPASQQLRDVCFYRFLKVEPLQVEIIENLLLPNLGSGRLPRERIRQYLQEKFPGAGSIPDCAQAIIETLNASGVARADRAQLYFTYREIPETSLAFILHSEFPEPAIYDLRKVEEHPLLRAMLWNPAQLLTTLYELRNLGRINKISEIDNVRQFTTRFTLTELVNQIISKGK